MAALRGVEGARELVAWMSNFTAGRFVSGDKGFRPVHGTAFYLAFHPDGSAQPYMTWRELEAGNIARKFTKDSAELAGTIRISVCEAFDSLAHMGTADGNGVARTGQARKHRTNPCSLVRSKRLFLRPDLASIRRAGAGRVKFAAPLRAAGPEPRAARPSRASMARTHNLTRPVPARHARRRSRRVCRPARSLRLRPRG